MKYPCLVPKSLCKTPIRVSIYGEGLTEDGAPEVLFEGDFLCNYQDKARAVLTKEQKLVKISGFAIIRGDVAEELAVISGGDAWVSLDYMLKSGNKFFPNQLIFPGRQLCVVQKRRIAVGEKARNPDGTVNYTRLELE